MVFAVKGLLKFDPNEYDYGPATTAIRSIVVDWVDVDWFEPTGAPDEELVRSREGTHRELLDGNGHDAELLAPQGHA
jgi:hypothetical protein